ncbi:MAG: FmdB family transcriptional regulator [Opitutaceae bacterium]|nr:FmdB family transcriptional regulator [Opitutaceae bacterium]
MPIYEFYCPETNRIYSFYAKTIAQGQTTPKCPDNPDFQMKKLVSAFAVTGRTRKADAGHARGRDEVPEAGGRGAVPDAAGDARMEAAFSSMEKEMEGLDENDPKAMAHMMRRMSELTGEKLDDPMEEVVRKLEEGADPDTLEDGLGDQFGEGEPDPYGDPYGEGPGGSHKEGDPKEPKHRFRARRSSPPMRDPKLYDYE